jgi:hypothetical protein
MMTTFETGMSLGLAITLVGLLGTAGQEANQSTKLTVGEVTNGVRGEIEQMSVRGKLTEVVVWVARVTDAAVPGIADPLGAADRIRQLDWDYWMPTNSFCGPIELRDETGQTMTSHRLDTNLLASYTGREFPLNPDVSSLEAYPPAYILKVEHDRYFSRFRQGYSGPGIFPIPLFVAAPRSELVRFQVRDKSKSKGPPTAPTLYLRQFQLEDFYEMKEGGEYQLTVWPKIYRRSVTNGEVCERIDIPAVSVTLKK